MMYIQLAVCLHPSPYDLRFSNKWAAHSNQICLALQHIVFHCDYIPEVYNQYNRHSNFYLDCCCVLCKVILEPLGRICWTKLRHIMPGAAP